MPHEVPRLQRDGLIRPEDFSIVRVPRASEHDDVALVGMIVRTAHHTGGKVIDGQVVAWLGRIALDDRGLHSQCVSFRGPPRQLVELDAYERPFGISTRKRDGSRGRTGRSRRSGSLFTGRGRRRRRAAGRESQGRQTYGHMRQLPHSHLESSAAERVHRLLSPRRHHCASAIVAHTKFAPSSRLPEPL